jgi:PAS domain S-box-containing protein
MTQLQSSFPRAVHRVLQVDSDREAAQAARALLAAGESATFDVEWVRSCAEGVEALRRSAYDVVLLSYDPGEEAGLRLLERKPLEDTTPVVLLVDGPLSETDRRAAEPDVMECLDRADLTPALLQRSIRYVIERRRTSEARREAELRFHLLMEAVGAIVWQADPATMEFSLVSQEAETLLGHPVSRWLEDPGFWLEHVHPDDRPGVLDVWRNGMGSGECRMMEYRMVAADGRFVWLRNVVRTAEVGGRAVRVGVMVDVTDRRRAEEALHLQERSLEAITEGILISDPRQPDNPIVHVNSAFLGITGYGIEDVLGRNCRFLQGPGTDPVAVREMRDAVESGGGFSGEILNYRRDGEPFWNQVSFSPLRDLEGRITHYVGVQRDVTERRKLSQRVEVERARLAAVIQQAPAFMATARGPDHVFVMANARYRQLVGDRELIGRPVREALPEVVEQGIVEILDEVYRTGTPFVATELPMLLQTRQDRPPEERILTFVYQPLREEDGSVSGILAHGLDVTEQARTQERLRTAEAHYRRLVTTAPLTVYALDSAGCFIELNPAAERLLQRPAETLIGRRFSEIIAPEDRDRAEGMFRRAIAGAVEQDGESLRIVRPSGEQRLLNVTFAPIRDAQVTGVHGIARDITEERAREHRARMLTAALDNLHEGVSVMTAAGEFLYANAAHARLLGYDPDAADGVTLNSFLGNEPGDVDQLRQVFDTIREEESWSGRIRSRRRLDGETIPLDAFISRVWEGERELFFVVLRDASSAISRDQHLRRVERLASVGTLIGGVAHELNNPLHAIRNFAELMLLDDRAADDRESLEIIRREADRAAKVVADLRLIARETQDEVGTRTPVDLNDVVQHVLRVRRYSLDTNNVRVREDLGAALPPVLANRSEIEQVILNLVVNAEQAMAAQARERTLILRTRHTPGGAVLHVVDSGPGISPDHLTRIFDPFFTTKSPGEGTGLGLSLVHSIITEHGGHIEVDSEVGQGTAFRFDLPRAPDQTAGAPETGAAADEPHVSLRVLVVDDEPAIRSVTARFLTRSGHRVDSAVEGEEALRMIRESDYDLILSDLRMPGLSGEELYAKLSEMGGGLEERVVFLTGDVASESVARLIAETDVPVLVKPIAFDHLARTVRAAARTALERTDPDGV